MPQQTTSEKEMFLQTWENEFQTTLKVLKAYPADKIAFRPSANTRTAGELVWTMATGELIAGFLAEGGMPTTAPPPAPSEWAAILSRYEALHREAIDKVKSAPEAKYQDPVKFMTGPQQFADVPRSAALWMVVMDAIHHRGQFSIYSRIVGAKVPSIYGPTLDEPWN